MRVCFVTYFDDGRFDDPEKLLDRYETIPGWREAVRDAGADVTSVHRFRRDTVVSRNGIVYHFVEEPARLRGPFDLVRRINTMVISMSPDVVHVHGFMFACQAAKLKRSLRRIPIIIQDHADKVPSLRGRLALRPALQSLDAFCVTTAEHAGPWRRAGLIPASGELFEIMEGSTRFKLLDRDVARSQTGLRGDPLILWVGRLDENKDPITILKAFSLALQRLPGSYLAMVYHDAPMLDAIKSWLRSNPETAGHVRLIGCVPHRDLEEIYNGADLFVLGSHHEGSGYAALEALACGVIPVLSDIPSFRLITGEGTIGGLFPIGDAEAAAEQLIRWNSSTEPGRRLAVRRWFERQFSFEAIGRKAVGAYTSLVQRRS